MRSPLALLGLTAACGALAAAAVELNATLSDSPAPAAVAPGAAAPQVAALVPPASDPLPFPPVFGRAVEPSTVPAPATTAPAPAAPSHRLTGLIVAGDTRWAVLDGPGGNLVLQEGDALDATWRIARITATGVTLDGADTTLALAFAPGEDSAPEQTLVAAVETPAALPAPASAKSREPHRKMVGSQPMSAEQVLALLALPGTR